VALEHALTEKPAVYQFHASARQGLVEAAWKACGLLVHQQLVWVKARPVLTHAHYLWQHEPCFYGWPRGKQPTKRPPPAARTVWTPGDAWDTADPIEEDGAAGLHPTQKPVGLIRRMVEYHTEPGEVVYEPFAGSGTCLVACELSGRRCSALELAPAYCDAAVSRWERLTGKMAVRVPAGAEVDAA
jgi:DNA modification methylase